MEHTIAVQILKQLRVTKWFGVLTGLSMLVMMFFMAASIAFYLKDRSEQMHGYSLYRDSQQGFSRDARALLNAGEYTELLSLSKERTRNVPSDAYGFFYLGSAHYMLRQWDSAIDALQKADLLAPHWKGQYTDIYIDVAKRNKRPSMRFSLSKQRSAAQRDTVSNVTALPNMTLQPPH